MKEANVRNKIILHAAKKGVTLFNNPVGVAWHGKLNPAKSNLPQFAHIIAPTRVTYGLAVGSSDLIGFTPVTITPDMVGKTLAVFTAVEVKKDKDGRYKETEGQSNFGAAVKRAGGLYKVCDSNSDFDELVDGLTQDAVDVG